MRSTRCRTAAPSPSRSNRPARAATASPGWVTVRVCDTGRGLPSELGSKIFEPFVSTKPTGIGLGLSICKRIVESHGGQIEAVNRPEGGAEFTIRLPGNCHSRNVRRGGACAAPAHS